MASIANRLTLEPLNSWHQRLPAFSTPQELERPAAAAWKRYLEEVYGQLLHEHGKKTDGHAAARFPIDLRTFNFFYYNILPRDARPVRRAIFGFNSTWTLEHDVPPGVSKASIEARAWLRSHIYGAPYERNPPFGRRHGDAFVQFAGAGNLALGQGTAWVYAYRDDDPYAASSAPAFPGEAGFTSGTDVEVYRCASGPVHEYWMYHATGSGIFFQLGMTIAFRDRATMSARNASFGGLRVAKYDSVQFTHTQENGIFKFEILDLRQHQPYRHEHSCGGGFCTGACPREDVAAAGIFRRGWGAEGQCTCVEGHGNETAESHVSSEGASGIVGRCMRCAATAPDMGQIALA